MEYVDGPSAQALLDRYGKLPIGDAVHLALDIAHALEHAQSRNIVHRDIKPENILITRTGVAKLADLGLAKQLNQASSLTATRQGFGTPYYMPYEQAINAKDADGRSDIYALGATLYHLVTGQVPFKGDNQVEILEKKEIGYYAPASLLNTQVPDELDRILDKMLARDPRDRYQTASELIVDLERSGLAVPVLSFVDRELALQDPVVRQRAAAIRQTTQPDMQRGAAAPPRIWYLRYTNPAGKLCMAKATTRQVLQLLHKGRLNGMARAARSPKGPFRRLGAYTAFRAAVEQQRHAALASQPAKEPPADEAPAGAAFPTWLLAAGAAGIGLLLLGLLYLLLS
jgi:serine/threonine-protein kinase